MTVSEVMERWKKTALEDFVVAQDMLRLGHYDWVLFMGQLTLEKLFKGLVARKTNAAPPFTHDLPKLASLAGLALTNEQEKNLADISTYHIRARYENIKTALYRKATRAYTEKYFAIIKEYVLWLQKLY